MNCRSKLNIFSIGLALATWLLIIAGASVTSTGSGLAVPDWPLSYGQWFPRMAGGVLFEHGHRLIAGTVAGLTIVFAFCLWRFERRGWVLRLGYFSVLVVLLQALLGGLTVLYSLPPVISIAHAILGQTFFCLVVSLALFTSPEWQADKDRAVGTPGQIELFSILSGISVLVLYCQLVAGARLRHGGGTGALNLHIGGAVCVVAALLTLFLIVQTWFSRHKPFVRLTQAQVGLLIMQINLGLASLFPYKLGWLLSLPGIYPAILSVHVAVGAGLLALTLILALLAWQLRHPFSCI